MDMNTYWIIVLILLLYIVTRALWNGHKPVCLGDYTGDPHNLHKMILFEPLKTTAYCHKIFWVGPDKYDPNLIRIGIEFNTGSKRRYFFDWNEFKTDPRYVDMTVMTRKQGKRAKKEIEQSRKK